MRPALITAIALGLCVSACSDDASDDAPDTTMAADSAADADACRDLDCPRGEACDEGRCQAVPCVDGACDEGRICLESGAANYPPVCTAVECDQVSGGCDDDQQCEDDLCRGPNAFACDPFEPDAARDCVRDDLCHPYTAWCSPSLGARQ